MASQSRRKDRERRSTTPSKRWRIVDGACGSKFRIYAWKRLPGTDRLGPVDYRIRANPVRPLSFPHIAGSDGRVLDMETIKQLQRFYMAEVFRPTSYPWFSRIRKPFLSQIGRVPLTRDSLS